MISIKKNSVLWIIIVVLLLINLATLGSVWFSKSDRSEYRRDRSSRSGSFIEQSLNFDEEQSAAYQQLRQKYFEKAKDYYEQIKEQKTMLFKSLRNPEDGQNIEATTAKIGELQAELELLTYNHFLQIRNLTNEDQKADFDSLMEKLADRSVKPFPGSDSRRDGHRGRKYDSE